MPKLPNAPLRYTLGVIHFTPLPGVERFVDKLLDAVRSQYPLREAFNISNFEITLGPEGMRANNNPSQQFQFSTPDRKWAFAFSSTNFALHTIDYRDHEHFMAQFRWGLERLLNVEGIGIEWWTGAGIRYVNCIEASGTFRLSDYLKSGVLPQPFESDSTAELNEGVYFSRYTTSEGVLRFTTILNPPAVFPPGVQTPLTDKNGWTIKTPDGDFAVIDIDHSITHDTPVEMSVDGVCRKLLDLRERARAVFDKIGTDQAVAYWRGQ